MVTNPLISPCVIVNIEIAFTNNLELTILRNTITCAARNPPQPKPLKEVNTIKNGNEALLPKKNSLKNKNTTDIFKTIKNLSSFTNFKIQNIVTTSIKTQTALTREKVEGSILFKDNLAKW